MNTGISEIWIGVIWRHVYGEEAPASTLQEYLKRVVATQTFFIQQGLWSFECHSTQNITYYFLLPWSFLLQSVLRLSNTPDPTNSVLSIFWKFRLFRVHALPNVAWLLTSPAESGSLYSCQTSLMRVILEILTLSVVIYSKKLPPMFLLIYFSITF